MKKILAVIAAVVLVATLSFGAVMLTSADVSPLKVTVSSATATKGETKDITIGFTSNDLGVSSAKFTVTFPSDLTMEKATFNKAMRTFDEDEESTSSTNTNKSKVSPVILNWVSYSQNITGDVIYATLSFKVSDDATLGDKDIQISAADGDIFYYSSGTYADQNLQTTKISPDFVNGKITVVNCLHQNTTDYPAVPSTCTVAGHAAYTYCEDCQSVISGDATPLDLAEHTKGTATRENEIPATCTAEGSYNEVVKCTVCGTTISSTPKTIKKLDHTPGAATRENEIPAKCTVDGSYDEVVKCTECGTTISSTPRTIKAPGHTPGTPVKENVVGADCTNGGTYDEVVYCTVCKAEISRTPRTTGALGHTEPAEWSYDSASHWKECTVCQMVIGESAAHTFEHKIIKAATVAEEGEEGDVCTVCGYKENTTTIPKLIDYTDTKETAYDANNASTSNTIATKMTKANFSGVSINGVTLSSEDYDLTEDESGNAKVTIKPAYLAKLANGSYTVEIVGTNGIATSTLTVSNSTVGTTPATDNTVATTTTTTTAKTATGDSPKTADSDIAFLVIALLAVMGSSVFAGVTYRRKRNSK